MGLSIRDPRASELAREIADRQGTTMTAVIINLLEREAAKGRKELTVFEKLTLLQEEAEAMAGPNKREVTKEEIDDLWTAE
jgi:antitoxin VapB